MIGSESFAAFVLDNSRSLFGTAYLLTGDRAAAEELLQDTLARLAGGWATVSRADSPVAYARRSLVNRFVDSRRSSGAAGEWLLPEGAGGEFADRRGTGHSADVAEAVVDRQLVWQLLGELSAKHRAAVVLRYFHDQTDEQIAQALGCRPVTVRSLVSRGIATMRRRSAEQHADATSPPEEAQ